MLKYFLNLDYAIIAIKYDETNKVLVIGGNKLYTLEIRMIIEDYFNFDFESSKDSYKIYNPQRNKIRFNIINYPNNDFYDAGKLLKKNGHNLKPTKTLKNIMR